MKVRKGFVSNSSTTSFTCELCGETEAFHDSSDAYNDYGQVECENGHSFHIGCIEDDLRKKIVFVIDHADDDEYCDDDDEDDDVDSPSEDEFGEELKAVGMTKEEFKLYADKFHDTYGFPAAFCPVCQFKALDHNYALRFLKEMSKADDATVLDWMKTRFGTFKAVMEHFAKEKE